MDQFFDIQGRTPFGNRDFHNNSVAFIINPSKEINELLSYDAYKKGTENGDITQEFVVDLPIEDLSKCAAVLYGVPSEAISGIVVGNKILNDIEKINFIKEKFSDCYIISNKGEVIYNPLN